MTAPALQRFPIDSGEAFGIALAVSLANPPVVEYGETTWRLFTREGSTVTLVQNDRAPGRWDILKLSGVPAADIRIVHAHGRKGGGA